MASRSPWVRLACALLIAATPTACADVPSNPCDQPLRDGAHPSIQIHGSAPPSVRVNEPVTLRVTPQTTGDLGCVWFVWQFSQFPEQPEAVTRVPEATVRYSAPGDYAVQVGAYTTRGPTAHVVVPVHVAP